MRTKQVQGYYFFTITFKRQVDEEYLAQHVYEFWTESANRDNDLLGDLLRFRDTECLKLSPEWGPIS